jgi:hypothetical protein
MRCWHGGWGRTPGHLALAVTVRVIVTLLAIVLAISGASLMMLLGLSVVAEHCPGPGGDDCDTFQWGLLIWSVAVPLVSGLALTAVSWWWNRRERRFSFRPPPGWPPVPAGWIPPPRGWQPDPSWPPAPPGWTFWSRTVGRPTVE